MLETIQNEAPPETLWSEQFDQITTKLAAAQGKYPEIKKQRVAKIKTKSGYEYSYEYADLGDILPKVLPVLSAEDIAFAQFTIVRSEQLWVRTTIFHGDQWMMCDYPVARYTNQDHQAIGAALTYAKRQSACSLLGIVAEGDIDASVEATAKAGDASSSSKAPAKKRTTRKMQTVQNDPPMAEPEKPEPDLPPDVSKKLSVEDSEARLDGMMGEISELTSENDLVGFIERGRASVKLMDPAHVQMLVRTIHSIPEDVIGVDPNTVALW